MSNARTTQLGIGLVMLGAFLFHAGITVFVRFPHPTSHDEFSYLLAADTFAHGRLTNPTHPKWEFFESFHILHEPSYQSKYPPGQGLFLALGQMLSGYPIVGAWIATALACGAVCWMLQAWIDPRWGIVGGLLTMIHPHMIAWGQSYWGGTLAVLGAALVLGAFRRILANANLSNGIALGTGLLILANSRPYEGLILSLPVIVTLSILAKGRNLHRSRACLACWAILLVGGSWMMFYNWRVTGDALQMPYRAYESDYGIAPLFVWQNPVPMPLYRHDVMREFYNGWPLEMYLKQHSLDGFLDDLPGKFLYIRDALFSLPMLWVGFRFWTIVPLLGLIPLLRRDHWLQGALAMLVCVVVGVLVETYLQVHYTAVGLPLVLYLMTLGMRSLSTWTIIPMQIGKAMSAVVLLLALLAGVQGISNLNLRATEARRACVLERAKIVHQLRSDGRQHLVFVRYIESHDPISELVYNEADIDASPVVFARDMGDSANRQLMDYFGDRVAWILEVAAQPAEVQPYRPPN